MEENKNIIDEITAKDADVGKVNISNDVVGSIAGIATAEIDGIYGMSGSVASGIAEKLGAKKSPSKGVKVDIKPGGAVIDLYVIVEFGMRIPELAWNVQQNVKNSVETMTGIDVARVNVHFDGLHINETKKTTKKSKKQKNTDETDTTGLLEDSNATEEE